MLLPNLQTLRLERLFSQAALAKKADLSRNTIYKLEGGGDAQLLTVYKLAKALGVEPAELYRSTPDTT